MVDIEDLYELSPMQQSMLLDHISFGSSSAYGYQLHFRLKGVLNEAKLRDAWTQVVSRHAALRTSFHWEEVDVPIQVVHRKSHLPYYRHDLTAFRDDNQSKRLEELRKEFVNQSFDLAVAPLMRLDLVKLATLEHELIWTFHHIILEGWSASIIMEEVTQVYRESLNLADVELPERRLYRDFILWIQQQDSQREEKFWRDVLEDYRQLPAVGTEQSSRTDFQPTKHHDHQQIMLSSEMTRRFEMFCRGNRLTPSTIIHAAWALLIARFSGQSDVIVGSVVSGRSVPFDGIQSMVGLCTNLIPFRAKTNCRSEIAAWLQEIQRDLFELRKHEFCNLQQLKSWSDLPPGTPLFEHLVVYQNWLGDLTTTNWGDSLHATESTGTQGSPGYALSLVAIPGERLTLRIEYDVTRYDECGVHRLLDALKCILMDILSNTAAQVDEINALTSEEKQRIIYDWNDTGIDTGLSSSIPELFEAQVRSSPDAIAVVHQDRQLTYDEINRLANRLANKLVKQGVHNGSLVGIYAERSLEMIVGILGIMKSGAAYVPLDPSYPSERIRFMLEDAAISRIVVTKDVAEDLPENEAIVIPVDLEQASTSRESPSDPIAENDLAYVIYTSGSTGNPKGVLIEHHSLTNYTRSAARQFGLAPGDRVLQFASISFDTAAEEIFPCLTSGATLVLRTDEMLNSAKDFLEACREQRLTVLDLPTSYWGQLTAQLEEHGLDFPPLVRLVILGGEKAHAEKIEIFKRHIGANVRVVNTYGPTETTIVATSWELPQDPGFQLFDVPIGRPIDNTKVYVLDQRQRPVPVGVQGELYIGGAGVARGYLNRPDLTREKFVPNPFAPDSGERIFRTGDLVRYRSDGNLLYQGRIDHQVKLRGFRIELGEIESVLDSLPFVQSSVVSVWEDNPGDPRLVAYLVMLNPVEKLDTQAVRQALQQQLPNYMVPSAFVVLDRFPLTPNGKINRAALPAPEFGNSKDVFVAPRNQMESDLARIWQELFGIEQVGIHDDFFGLGGDSLLAIRLLSQIHSHFHISLPLQKAFQARSVAEMADVIKTIQWATESQAQLANLGSEDYEEGEL